MAKRLVDRSVCYRIIEAVGRSDLVGCRCRIVLAAQSREVEKDERGFMCNLQGYMVTGKQKASTVDLPPVRLEQVKGYNCHCKAYKFPHAPGLGQCKSEGESTPPPELNLEELFL